MIDSSRPLVLGSASPRRRDILGALGIPFVVLPADVDENTVSGEAPAAYLERIVAAKLQAVRARLQREREVPTLTEPAAILVADTIVVLDRQILGKPAGEADAVRTLLRLVGKTHVVMTRYVVAAAGPGAPGGVEHCARTVVTRVRMRGASIDEVRAYAATGEGLDKAGAYAAQGIGAFLVEAVEGSYTNVVGLPACELVADLRQAQLLLRFPLPRPAGV